MEQKAVGSRADQQYPWLEERRFTQKLDHFDPYNTGTWQQKYYYNPKYYRNNSIIFLMIGGEGPETPHWAADPDVSHGCTDFRGLTDIFKYSSLIIKL